MASLVCHLVLVLAIWIFDRPAIAADGTNAEAADGNATSASQGDSDGEDARRARFRSAVLQATECYQRKEYSCALDSYQKAYQTNPRPQLLFNIAQVYRKANHPNEAIVYFQRFLRDEPETELRQEVERYLLEVKVDQGQTSQQLQTRVPSEPADNFTGTEEQRAQFFQQHVSAGVAKYQAGEFEEAAAEYWAAYGLRRHPILLFNVAQSYRKARRWPEAQTLYQRFLKEDPLTPLSGEIDGYLGEIQAQIQTERLQAEKSREARLAEANAKLTEKLVHLALLERDLAHRKKLDEWAKVPNTPVYRRRWFWAVTGSVTAVTVLAIGLGVGLSSRLPAPDFGTRMLEF